MKIEKHVLTRRDFIRGTIGAAIGTSILGLKWPEAVAKEPRSSLVVIVREKSAMDSSKNVDSTIVKKMLEQALVHVTGQKNPKDAWLSLVKPTDMIGLVPTDHLNPTHEEVVEAVKSSLMDAGIPRKRITLAQGGA